MDCPDANLIAELIAGVLPDGDRPEVEAHVADCEECRRAVVDLGTPPPLVEGAAVGRYRVLEQVGAGAMGAVYAAHDPELDRKVALKLLHHAGDQQRLVAEGRAMARLAHPHVVPVLDLGTTADQRVFVVMEFVEGITLRGWLSAEPRSWRRIVSLLGEAGRGLAAAHAVGLTHRDFKPENLLIGADGRTRVTDFGLARSGAAPSPSGAKAVPTVTHTSEMVGTPAYMSPEQFRAQPASARSDQFSFCVVLWEALYGGRPFDDGTQGVQPLAEAVLAGRTRDPGSARGVPAAIRRILLRGLAVDPNARFPSMEALLAALEGVGRRRRRVSAAIAVALAAVTVAGAGVAYQHRTSRLCQESSGRAAAVWNPARRSALARAFHESGVSYATSTWPHVEATVDQWVRAVTAMRQEACEATEIRRVQSREVLLMRNQCLDERQAELASLLEVLERPTPIVVERAAQAAASLGRVADCADLKQLVGPLRPRAEVAPEAEALRRRYVAVHARVEAGVVVGATAELTAIADRARALGDRPLEAEALVQRASLEYRDGSLQPALASARTAVTAAEEGRDDRTRALAWIGQIALQEELGSLSEAQHAAETAQAVLTRSGASDELRAQYELALGLLEQNAGSAVAARDHFLRALALAERCYPDGPELTDYLDHLPMPLMILGEYDAADGYLRRAMASIDKHRGREHPSFAAEETAQGTLALVRGHADLAIPLSRDAVARLERAFGPQSAELLEPLDILNSSLRGVGRVREALPVARRYLDIGLRAGAQSAAARLGWLTIGGTELEARHFDEAERALARAAALATSDGPPHPDFRKAHVRLAAVHLGRHETRPARAACEAAARELPPGDEWAGEDSEHCFASVEERERAFAPALARLRGLIAAGEKRHVSDAPWGVGADLVGAGRLLGRLGRGDEAVVLLERAIAGEPSPPVGVVGPMVEARLRLGQQLHARDRPRACALAHEAVALVGKQEFPDPELGAELRKLAAGCGERR